MFNKFNYLIEDDYTYIAIVLILVAGVAFLLGRSSVMPAASLMTDPTVRLEDSPLPVSAPALAPSATLVGSVAAPVPAGSTTTPHVPRIAAFVASRNGTKYHAFDCPGAAQIKEENRLYFTTENEAAAAGYSRAANCTFK